MPPSQLSSPTSLPPAFAPIPSAPLHPSDHPLRPARRCAHLDRLNASNNAGIPGVLIFRRPPYKQGDYVEVNRQTARTPYHFGWQPSPAPSSKRHCGAVTCALLLLLLLLFLLFLLFLLSALSFFFFFFFLLVLLLLSYFLKVGWRGRGQYFKATVLRVNEPVQTFDVRYAIDQVVDQRVPPYYIRGYVKERPDDIRPRAKY